MDTPDLRRLPAGRVELHDARRKRRWSVNLKSFEISPVPVTAFLYADAPGSNSQGTRVPAVDVSWIDAVAFCNKASASAGIDPAYTFHEGDVVWHTDSAGYRLPTEAEWEYACRAGTSGPHYGPLELVAWTEHDGGKRLQDVGLKRPNGFGLHDTLGNVWEWCWDLLDPARYGDYRVFRGGGFADKPWNVRASARRGGAPGMSHPDLGFRLARGAFAPAQETQGWSGPADRERGASTEAWPSGWTRRRL
ncbi:formylglycine-generating enzyme family protein [Arthrobacter sp. Z1-15]